MPGRGQPLYPLNVAAQLVGLSPRTLRLYEEAGLLAPTRSGGNQQRLYSEQDLQWLRCIRDMLHDESLTVTAIRRLLDLIPCWQIHHCSPEQALLCAPHLNIPQMASEPQASRPVAEHPAPATETPADGTVEIKLIYGVEELGAVLPCSRCISAERAARRVALRHPGQVRVAKYDLMSAEAARYGALLVPTVIVGDEVVAAGKGLSEEKLDTVVLRHLA